MSKKSVIELTNQQYQFFDFIYVSWRSGEGLHIEPKFLDCKFWQNFC
jgi:hypothetical protein